MEFFGQLAEQYEKSSTLGKVGLVAGGAVSAGIVGIFAAPAVGAAASAAGIGVLGGFLSGAAASSAGLAALGGGAVITGGFGVAGGTAVVATSAAALGAGAASALSYAASERAGKRQATFQKAKSTKTKSGDGIQ